MVIGSSPDPATVNADLSAQAKRWRDVATESVRLREWSLKLSDADLTDAYGQPVTAAADIRRYIDYMGGDLGGFYFGTNANPNQYPYDDALSAIMPPGT